MLLSIISVLIMLACVVLFFKNMASGLYMTMLAILFVPLIQVSSGFAFRIEHIIFPFFFVVLCVQSYLSRRPLSWPPIATYYGVWWLIGLTAGLIGVTTSNETKIDWLGMYGFLRPLFIILVFVNVFDQSGAHIIRFARALAISNIPLGALAVSQTLGVPFARDLTEQAFISPGRPVMGNQVTMEAAGYLFRALSVFENVSFAGTFFLLSVFSGVTLLYAHQFNDSKQSRWPIWAGIAVGISGGIATLSATFLGGLILIVAIVIFRQGLHKRIRMLIPAVGIVALLIATILILPEDSDLVAATSYQITKLFSFSGIADRYSSDSGQTADAVQATNERPLLGWGFVTKPDVIVNDSMYVTFYYYGGLLGMTVLIWLMVHLYFTVGSSNVHRQLYSVWIIIVVISGVSCTSMYIPRAGDWWWALAAMAYRLAPAREKQSVSTSKQRLAENPGL